VAKPWRKVQRIEAPDRWRGHYIALIDLSLTKFKALPG
jgi:hypothetical protein